jgi:hypothetical protein
MCTSVSSSEKVCCGPMNVVGIVPVRLLLLAKSILVIDPRWFSEGNLGRLVRSPALDRGFSIPCGREKRELVRCCAWVELRRGVLI